MNLVFWTILGAVTLGVGLHFVVHRRRQTTATNTEHDTSELFTPETLKWPLASENWGLRSVEFLATPDRLRAVARLDIDDADIERRQRAIEILAREIYRHTEVDAVFVEADGDRSSPDLYLFAADGRGWWGNEMISTAIAGPPAQKQNPRRHDQ